MERDPDSHKGDNGKVAIVGGSHYMHGAPLLAAKAAEASGVDLVYVALPHHHSYAAKMTSLNFQIQPFADTDLTEDDLEPILELLASMDCAVLGPGIALDEESLRVTEELIVGAACPLVLDASALQLSTPEHVRGREVILTPHMGELERMDIDRDQVMGLAADLGVTILLKGQTDHVYSKEGDEEVIEGGNAGLTVGGTGDTLAGLICGLVAQGIEPATACAMASRILKRAGTMLMHEKGYAYTAEDVIDCISHLLYTYND